MYEAVLQIFLNFVASVADTSKIKSYLKKIGLFGFLFFLIKGLVWVFVFLFIKNKL